MPLAYTGHKNLIDRGHLLRKMRKTKLENDITAYRMKCNEVNICLRKGKSKYYQNLLMDENFWSPERSWKVIKRIYPVKNKQSLPIKFSKVSSEFTSHPMPSRNGFANFYTEIVPKLKKLLLPSHNIIWRKEAECENFTFRTFKFRYDKVLSVQKHLKNLQRSKESLRSWSTNSKLTKRCSKWNRTITSLHYKSFTYYFNCTNRLEKG